MQQGNGSFRLIVRRGPQPNQTYELNKDIITVGRDITNDIVINDPEVSRHHMRFTRGGGGYTLEDLGSTNGTFINGQRLTGAKPLGNGDMIGLGETVTLGYERVQPSTASNIAGDVPEAAAPAPASPYARPPAGVAAPIPVEQESPAPAPQYNYSPEAPPSYSDVAQPPIGYSGTDYDPNLVLEDEPANNTMRWILIGCLGLSLFCCCATIAVLFLIDYACAWEQIPVISNVIKAFGYSVTC